MLQVVVAMEVEHGDQLLAELQSPHRVAQVVQGRGPGKDPHHVGDDQHHAAAHSGLGRQTHLEGELTGVVVRAAGVHDREHIPDYFRPEHLLLGGGTDASVGQTGGDHGHGLAVGLHGAALEVEVHHLLQVGALGEALVLAHVEAQGVVPVGCLPLGQEHGVVEADVLPAGQPLEPGHGVVEDLRGGHVGLDQSVHQGTGEDGPSVDHRIVRFLCGDREIIRKT